MLSSFFFVFSTGLVRLHIAGLPLRSCHTIGAPSVQGSAQCAFFSFLVAAGFEPTYFSLGSGHLNHYPILTPHFYTEKLYKIDILLLEIDIVASYEHDDYEMVNEMIHL